MPLKILYLITELNVGGAEKVLARLLTRLNRNRFDPTVVCLYGGSGPVAAEIRHLKIPVIDLGMTGKWRGDAFWRLYRLLHHEKPAILHTWLFHANLSGRILGRLSHVPIIICAERTMLMESEWRYRANRWTIGLVDRVVTVSDNVRQFYAEHVGLPDDKLVVIHNGIGFVSPSQRLPSATAARRRLNLPDDELVVGVVSRLEPVKGIDVLLKAFSQLGDAHLVIVGDGSAQASLQTLAQELNVSERVHWAGYRPNIQELLPALDIFVQPSLHEGLPNTVLEAMGAKLPVVATAVGGTPEVVVDSVTGLLVPPGNPAALAEAMTKLLNKPQLRRQMGQAGFERVSEHFTVQQMVERTEALYQELITDKLNLKFERELQ